MKLFLKSPAESTFLCEGDFYCGQVIKVKGFYYVIGSLKTTIGLAEKVSLNLEGEEQSLVLIVGIKIKMHGEFKMTPGNRSLEIVEVLLIMKGK
jgi:hypothetical protein